MRICNSFWLTKSALPNIGTNTFKLEEFVVY